MLCFHSQGCQSGLSSLQCEDSKKEHHGSVDQERKLKQYLQDERIALFLQNEEFMRELQRNREFLLALERGTLLAFTGVLPCNLLKGICFYLLFFTEIIKTK